MKAAKSHSKSRKFRRIGRHTAPSPTAKVARRARQAAPAVAVVGALAAAPQTAFASTAAPAAPAGHTGLAAQRHVTRTHWTRPRPPSRQSARSYTVRTGDTLSGIAQQFYGHASDWQWLYHINRAKISDPNLIYTGQVFSVPADPPALVRCGPTRPGTRDFVQHGGQPVIGRSGQQFGGQRCIGRIVGQRCAGRVRQCRERRPDHQCADWSRRVVFGVSERDGPGQLRRDRELPDLARLHRERGARITGNIWQESGGNPESVGDGGGGLIGSTPLPWGT